MKANKTIRRQEAQNYRRRKDKESEHNINSAAHSQILNNNKKNHVNDRNHHILININTEC
jgi:hypothetical protein